MNELPLVSIVTGYYNRKENLKESVQSILNQTYPNFEYIIFDDCSTDGTYELLKEFSDTRLRVIRTEKNVGFTKGIIQAISLTRGEFIAVHGAGDISRKDRITTQVTYLQKHPLVGIVACDRIDYKEGKSWEKINKDQNIVFKKGILYRSFISQGEVMFRKNIYDRVGGYDPWITYAQDRDLWVRMRNHCDFHRIPEILYERWVFKESVSQNLKKLVQQRFFSCLSREREIKGRDFSLLFRDRYQIVADEALTMHFRNKDNKHKGYLLRACYDESDGIINKLYFYFHWLPVINWLLYKFTTRRVYIIDKKLNIGYRDMDDDTIYRLAVLGRFR